MDLKTGDTVQNTLVMLWTNIKYPTFTSLEIFDENFKGQRYNQILRTGSKIYHRPEMGDIV